MKSYERASIDYFGRLRRRAFLFMQQRSVLAFSLLLFSVLSGTALVFRWAEHDTHEAIWRSIVYLLSGMDVDPPTTPIGKFAAGFALLCGLIFVSLLTGYIAAEFSQMIARSRAIPLKSSRRVLDNHVILFGWNRKVREVLAELDADALTQGFRADDFAVIADQALLEKPSQQIYRNVWHVQGRATESLKKADLVPIPGRSSGARIAAIIADPSLPPEEADRRTLLTLLAVENLYPDVVSIAEVLDPSNQEHFENAYADEVVMPTHFANMLLARTAVFPGVAAYVDELLSLKPSQTENIAKQPISFFTFTAQELGLIGKPLLTSISEEYGRSRRLIVGLFCGEEFKFVSEIKDSASRVLNATDSLITIARPEGETVR
jgi:hypothetical protein